MAIIYSYPNLPLSELNSVDTFTINGTNANGEIVTSTVSLSNLATYITNTGTGSGTTNTLTLWSDGPSGVLGDSILTQDVGATALTVTGNFISTGTGNFTGQVTIPATPAAATDAASKNYVDTEVAGIPAGLVFKGNWNANTNSPALASGTGTVGNYYVVSVAGNTDLDGITDWQVGDWAVFVEVGGVDKWDKIDQTFVSGSGASGQVTFWNTINTVNGDNDFYWDNANKRLGIGTTSPSVALQLGNSTAGETKLAIFNSEGGGEVGLTIQSRTNRAKLKVADNDSNAYVVAEAGKAFFGTSANGDATNVTVLTSGNVGIGTTSPSEKLEIDGDSSNAFIQITTPNANYAGIKFGDPQSAVAGRIQYYHGDNSMQFDTSGKFVFQGGNVGIGIDSPNALGFLEKVLNVSAGSSSSTTLHQAGITISGSSDANDSDDFAYLSFTNHQSTLSADRVAEIRVKKVGTDVDTGEFTFYTANGTSLAEVLTLDSSQNATFAGRVVIDDGVGRMTLSSTSGENRIQSTTTGFGAYEKLAFTADDYEFKLGNATFAGGVDAAGNVEARGYLQAFTTFYMRGNTLTLNKAGNGFLNFLTRDTSGSETVMNISNVGTLSTAGNATFAEKVNVAGSTNNESALNVLTQTGSIGSIGFETGSEITGIISSNTELMEFRVGDGIGMSSPKQLKIDDNGIEVTGDVEVTNSSDGLVLKSPNGTKYRVTVSNGGTLSVSAV